MEETAPSSVVWWKYLVWGVVAVAVFGLSVGAGYWWTRKQADTTKPTSVASQTPTQGVPGPVTLEVTSELEVVRLQGSVDTAALAHWWQILGVDSQALTFKELGGFPTYTPQRVNIVIKDISPLSLAERRALFSPVTGGQSGEIIAGSATVYDANQPERLAYYIYHHPRLFSPEYPEIIEENINRALFETLYVAVVGSTALTPDDYADKRETAFPPGGGWQGIVKLVAGGDDTGGQSMRWHDVRIEMAEKVQKLRQWRLVPQAQAQSCGGTFYCGVLSPNCKCSGDGKDCSVHGQSCGGPNNTCTCTPTCPSDPNLKNDCVKIGNVCGPRSNSCSNCVSEDFYTCAWSGPTPTPTDAPTCANCQAWEDELCGPPSCAANQRYQSRNCNNIEGCATTRCVSDSSCSATPTPTPCPTVATPGGLTATYNGGASSTFSWDAVSNSSTPVTYGLQIDNLGSGWTSDTCAGTVQGGDTCNLNYTGTSFSRPTNLGNSFRWRVKANNACGNTSNWTAWTNYTVPTPPNCTSFGGLTSIARNTISTHQVLASGDPIQGQLAWRCGAGGTWGDWQVADFLTKASPYTFDFNSNVTCGDASQSQPIQMAVNLYRGSCTNDGCRDLSPQKPALRQSLWFHA